MHAHTLPFSCIIDTHLCGVGTAAGRLNPTELNHLAIAR